MSMQQQQCYWINELMMRNPVNVVYIQCLMDGDHVSQVPNTSYCEIITVARCFFSTRNSSPFPLLVYVSAKIESTTASNEATAADHQHRSLSHASICDITNQPLAILASNDHASSSVHDSNLEQNCLQADVPGSNRNDRPVITIEEIREEEESTTSAWTDKDYWEFISKFANSISIPSCGSRNRRRDMMECIDRLLFKEMDEDSASENGESDSLQFLRERFLPRIPRMRQVLKRRESPQGDGDKRVDPVKRRKLSIGGNDESPNHIRSHQPGTPIRSESNPDIIQDAHPIVHHPKRTPYQELMRKAMENNFSLSQNLENVPVPGLIKARIVKLVRKMHTPGGSDSIEAHQREEDSNNLRSMVALHIESSMHALQGQKDSQTKYLECVLNQPQYHQCLGQECVDLIREEWKGRIEGKVVENGFANQTPPQSAAKEPSRPQPSQRTFFDTIQSTASLVANIMIDENQVCQDKALFSASRQLESDAFKVVLMERDLSPPGMSLILDERTGIVFATAAEALNDAWTEATMKWIAERGSACFQRIVILIQTQSGEESGLTNNSEPTSMINLPRESIQCVRKMTLACLLLRPKVSVSIRLTSSAFESAKLIRGLCDMSALASSTMAQNRASVPTLWFERQWLGQRETSQERLLGRMIPFFNSFVACEILCSLENGMTVQRLLELAGGSDAQWESEITTRYPRIPREILAKAREYLVKDLSPKPRGQQDQMRLATPPSKRSKLETHAKRQLLLDSSEVTRGGQTRLQWSGNHR